MAIKVTIPEGQTHARASDLYQWDYGQVLEIEAPTNLPTALEVHFACRDMSEAVIHACSATNKVASVVIPDQCLETGNEITAWVYEINGTTGRTLYRITIPVIARTRPSRGESIPVEVQDTYTQMITAVNEAVDKIVNGGIMVANAARATSADRAMQADNASSAAHAEQASYATNAGSASTALRADNAANADKATTASTATKATQDKTGVDITTKYTYCNSGFTKLESTTFLGVGTWQFRVYIFGIWCCAIMETTADTTQASLGLVDGASYMLRCTGDGKPKVIVDAPDAEHVESEAVIYFRQINNW